jgi:hypothetical protein
LENYIDARDGAQDGKGEESRTSGAKASFLFAQDLTSKPKAARGKSEVAPKDAKQSRFVVGDL